MPWLWLLAKILGLLCLVVGALLFLAVWAFKEAFLEGEDDDAGNE